MSGFVIILALCCITFSSLHVHYDLGNLWKTILESETDVLIRYSVIIICLSILVYGFNYVVKEKLSDLEIEPPKIFVDNSRALNEIPEKDSQYTRAAIARLEKSSEFQRAKKLKGTDEKNWNWQTRESEGFASDLSSEDEI